MTPEEIAALKAENEKLKADLDKATKKPEPKDDPPPEDPDLIDKARKDREAASAKVKETQEIESALKFNMGVDSLLKDHKSDLPEELESIIKTAKGETYSSEIARANAMRAAIIQSFFALEENLGRLTTSQRSGLDSFLKLAKNIREERAAVAYETFFEPTLNSIKQAKRAIELDQARKGMHAEGDVEKAYKERLIRHSKKALLGAKETA